MRTDKTISIKEKYELFVLMLNHIYEKHDKYYELKDNRVIFYKNIFDEIYFEFKFDKTLWCYDFKSIYLKDKPYENFYDDFTLDLINIINEDNFIIFTKKKAIKNDNFK